MGKPAPEMFNAATDNAAALKVLAAPATVADVQKLLVLYRAGVDRNAYGEPLSGRELEDVLLVADTLRLPRYQFGRDVAAIRKFRQQQRELAIYSPHLFAELGQAAAIMLVHLK